MAGYGKPFGQQGQVPQSNEAGIKLAGYKALAEGISKAGDTITQLVRQQQELELKKSLAEREFAMLNQKQIMETGTKTVPSKDAPNKWDSVPAPEEQAAMLRAKAEASARYAQLEWELTRPIREDQAASVAAALRSLPDTEEEVTVPIIGGEPVTGKMRTPQYTEEQATGIAKGLVSGGSSGAAIANIISSKVSKEEKLRNDILLKRLDLEGKMALGGEKTLADKQKQEREQAFELEKQRKNFEQEIKVLGLKFDEKTKELEFEEAAKKRIMDYGQKAGLSEYQIAKIFLEVQADYLTLRQLNRQIAGTGKPAITAEDRARELIEEAKRFSGSLKGKSPEAPANTPAKPDFTPEEQAKIDAAKKRAAQKK